MTFAKRAFDVVFAGAGLLLLSPLFLAVAIAIRIGDGAPAFFRQIRVGRGGRTFRIWKFRTMRAAPPGDRPLITIGDDPRITPLGRRLRGWKIDELPQLLNVLAGDMSLVGPRPEVPRYVDLYTAEQRAVLELTPGITDPASIHYRRESELLASAADPERLYAERILPDKLRINLEYARRATPLRDLGVMLRTVIGLVRNPKGPDAHATPPRGART